MFEPDGRNSIQTLGHWTILFIKWMMWAFAALVLIPVIVALFGWQTYKLQKAGVEAVPMDKRIEAVMVDFNEATLGTYDADVFSAWEDARHNAGGSSATLPIDPSLRSLPFQVTYLKNTGAEGGAFHWQPQEKPLDTTWLYYNLPWERGCVYDKAMSHAREAGILPQSTGTELPSALDVPLDRDINNAARQSDPWFFQGLFKMAPTKWWDWHTGLQLTHAKASYNYRAYVTAARAVARMRYLMGMKAARAQIIAPVEILSGYELVPSRALCTMTPEQREAYTLAYRRSFQGKLPRVLLLTQPLDDQTLRQDPSFAEWHHRVGDSTWDMFAAVKTLSSGPYVTGLTRWEGNKTTSRWDASVAYSPGDFFYRSTPYLKDEAKDTQKLLLQVQTFSFWKPLLIEAGFGDTDTLALAKALLEDVRKDTTKDTAFARRYGHEAFYHKDR